MKVLGRNVLFSYSNMNSLCSFKSYNFRVLCLCWFSPKKDRNSLCISQPQQMSTVSYNLFISKCLSLKTKGLLIDLAIFLVILTVRSSEKFPFSSPSILCSKAEGMNMEHVFLKLHLATRFNRYIIFIYFLVRHKQYPLIYTFCLLRNTIFGNYKNGPTQFFLEYCFFQNCM